MKKIALVFIIGLLIFGCGSRKSAIENKPETNTETIEKPDKVEAVVVEEVDVSKTNSPVINSTTSYISTYKDIAMEEMRSYNIPASITLAQGILESGSGKGRLAVKANNHFGIKCHDWNGDKIYHDDDRSQECFRKYNNSSYSFRDHSEFLAKRKRYSNLFKFKKDDYKAWAKELRRAGYATDKKYPQKLIGLIERYELYKFDETVLGGEIKMNDTYIVEKDDTLYSISKRFNLTVKELQVINNFVGTELKIGQVLNITTPKN
jgi:flagellum-specific peptidoglycan hydrolase FlgJ